MPISEKLLPSVTVPGSDCCFAPLRQAPSLRNGYELSRIRKREPTECEARIGSSEGLAARQRFPASSRDSSPSPGQSRLGLERTNLTNPHVISAETKATSSINAHAGTPNLTAPSSGSA